MPNNMKMNTFGTITMCSHIVFVYSTLVLFTLCYHHSIFAVFTYQSPSHLFHLPQSISFILLKFTLFHFISHLSCLIILCYIAIQFYFHYRLRNMILLKYIYIYIHLCAEMKIYASKPDSVLILQIHQSKTLHYFKTNAH